MDPFILVAGARPNFMKIAPLQRALVARGVKVVLVHTGQHYDALMSDVFFDELGIPKPDLHLGIGPGDRKMQTQKIMRGLVEHFPRVTPRALIVVGDVTSTAAAAMAGVHAGVPVAHVEAGLRSFNWKMPEELNRMMADHYADILFASDPAALKNLEAENIPSDRVFHVGNIMIDTFRRMEPMARAAKTAERLGLASRYGIVTLHRPENVDNPVTLRTLWETLSKIAAELELVFPVHPRTRQRLDAMGLTEHSPIRLIDPIGYTDMLSLTLGATCIFTDSGGLQEEATVAGVPCLTLRTETERPITVDVGTSEIVGRDPERILAAWKRLQEGNWKRGEIPDLWDGHTAERIADILIARF